MKERPTFDSFVDEKGIRKELEERALREINAEQNYPTAFVVSNLVILLAGLIVCFAFLVSLLEFGFIILGVCLLVFAVWLIIQLTINNSILDWRGRSYIIIAFIFSIVVAWSVFKIDSDLREFDKQREALRNKYEMSEEV